MPTIKNQAGARVVDFKANNLHLMSYSIPLRKRMRLAGTQAPFIHVCRTTRSGFPIERPTIRRTGDSASDRDLERLPDGEYEVVIDSSLQPGSLTYGERYLPGERSDEILISCHVCHPSLCNDNLSGIAVAVQLAQTMAARPRRYSYRFLFIPGTIGSITWLGKK